MNSANEQYLTRERYSKEYSWIDHCEPDVNLSTESIYTEDFNAEERSSDNLTATYWG
ncbi:MAG: hypothetical protein PHY31_00285 [Smithellaceae bacterium]|nr:hypothetical protein [Smithellaceae bacterium]